ncbi:MAG: type II CAAX endopeptidase family protein [Bacilli bacterium]|nr:type II CAAX endopeptidase family protein [Bacilli bacterium]MDD4643419.1 type II CAAX endopeptidase family protein [Bacilli bacterium]
MNKKVKSTLIILYYFIYTFFIYIPFSILNIEIVGVLLFGISLIYIYREDFKNYLDDFKKNGRKYLKLGFNYWIIGLLMMIVSNIIISSLSPISMPENEQAVREALKLSPYIIFLSSVINAPLIEELIFRKTLFDIFKNKTLFVIFSGLLFGTFHVIGVATSIYSWLYIIPYSALGIAFAYAYTKTNNLLTPICLHSFHNFITIVQILLFLGG